MIESNCPNSTFTENDISFVLQTNNESVVACNLLTNATPADSGLFETPQKRSVDVFLVSDQRVCSKIRLLGLMTKPAKGPSSDSNSKMTGCSGQGNFASCETVHKQSTLHITIDTIKSHWKQKNPGSGAKR
eukprot:g52188.t1